MPADVASAARELSGLVHAMLACSPGRRNLASEISTEHQTGPRQIPARGRVWAVPASPKEDVLPDVGCRAAARTLARPTRDRVRVLPYPLRTAYLAVGKDVPGAIKDALHDAIDRANVDVLVVVPDDESWPDTQWRPTGTMRGGSRRPARRRAWSASTCSPTATSQAAELAGVRPVGGFSDAVFDVVVAHATGRNASH